MNPSARAVRNERGVALPLALFALVSLTALVLAFLSMGGMEPQISRNLSDSSQARYAAESGIEWAFDQLALAPSYTALLGGPPVTGSNPPAVWLTSPANTAITLPGLTANFGTYTVQIRNDIAATDPQITGQAVDGGGAASDTNGVLIVTAAGTYNGVTRQIQVVMRRVSLPPFPGAYNMPGAQADLLFTNTAFSIDGRDYVCTANCGNPDFTQRTYGLNASQTNMRYGLATGVGLQQNLCSGPCDGVNDVTYEQRAEQAFNTSAKRNNVIGKDQTNPAGPAVTGLNTVAGDASMGSLITLPDGQQTPAKLDSFLTQLRQFSGTQILQSTLACPMVFTGSAANPPTS